MIRTKGEGAEAAGRAVADYRHQAELLTQEAEATGQASRFLKIYEQYRKAPDITRRRIFLETMEKIFAGTDKIILDKSGGSGVVPYLPLNQLNKRPNTQAGGN